MSDTTTRGKFKRIGVEMGEGAVVGAVAGIATGSAAYMFTFLRSWRLPLVMGGIGAVAGAALGPFFVERLLA